MSGRVVNLKDKGAKFDVYIGRPSKWGNPYTHLENTTAPYIVETREEAIALYEQELRASPEKMAECKAELKNKTLGCFCSPLACHGDILVKMANEEDQVWKRLLGSVIGLARPLVRWNTGAAQGIWVAGEGILVAGHAVLHEKNATGEYAPTGDLQYSIATFTAGYAYANGADIEYLDEPEEDRKKRDDEFDWDAFYVRAKNYPMC